MKVKLTDEKIFSMLKEEYIKVPEGLDQQILSKLKVKKVNFFKTRLIIYSVAATIVLAIVILLNVLTVRSPMNPLSNIAYKQPTETVVEYDIFNDDELLLAYDGLYNEGFEDSYDLMDEEQDFSYEDELYEDIAFLENM
ncbi:MAG: hypothetical protein PF574_00240 [Candidatus Delongbacteria bacterium]|jgi:hypothetical protein|nr:hypothetical protein [Candidatus Delongbacteria bacterium]